MLAAEIFVAALGLYAALGLLFAIAFVTMGAPAIDAAARGMPIQARLIILPASAALWPWLALRWLKSKGRAA